MLGGQNDSSLAIQLVDLERVEEAGKGGVHKGEGLQHAVGERGSGILLAVLLLGLAERLQQ